MAEDIKFSKKMTDIPCELSARLTFPSVIKRSPVQIPLELEFSSWLSALRWPGWLSLMRLRLVIRRSQVQSRLGLATFFHGDWSWKIFYRHSLPSRVGCKHCFSFSLWICIRNPDQVNLLAENWKWACHLILLSIWNILCNFSFI